MTQASFKRKNQSMIKKFFIFCLIFLILCIQFISTPVESKKVDNQYNSSVSFDYNRTIKYSTNINPSKDELIIHASYIENQNIYLRKFVNDGSGYTTENFTNINLSEFYDFDDIQDFNSYNSNGTEFITITNGYSINPSFHLIIKNDNNFSQYILPSYLEIALITQLANSLDVYFSVYNSTTFMILKYSFDTESITTVFETQNLPIGSIKIISVDVYTLDNKIYALVLSKDSSTNKNISTSVYIINNNDLVIFSKTFLDFEFSSFTTYNEGLILYSRANSSFFSYNYAENNVQYLIQFIEYYQKNISIIRPFDNTSFLMSNYDYVVYYKMVNVNESIPNFQSHYGYYVVDWSYWDIQRSIQAMILDGQYYYLIAGWNQQSEFVIQVDHYSNFPSAFILTTSNYPDNNQTYSYYSEYMTSQVVGPSSFGIVVVIIVIILILGGIVIYKQGSRSNSSYYEPKDSSFLKNSNSNYLQNNHLTNIRGKGFCSDCGSSVIISDVFCQNCGKKL
jgi:hypothetical protein